MYYICMVAGNYPHLLTSITNFPVVGTYQVSVKKAATLTGVMG